MGKNDMKDNKIYTLFLLMGLMASAIEAGAQNLDPTVEVNKAYEGKLMEVHKPYIEMAVPDSVLRFDLDFDYSVSESPYKGAYEFSPYTMHMKPAPTMRDSREFYFKAGAGYQLHPEADIIWSPSFKVPLKMSIYGTHRSYFGSYWSMAEPVYDKPAVIGRLEKVDDGNRSWAGYDMVNKGGVKGQYDWTKGLFRFNAGYIGIGQKEGTLHKALRSYNSFYVDLGNASKRYEYDNFSYDVNASYRYLSDTRDHTKAGVRHVEENEFGVNAGFTYILPNSDGVFVEVGTDVSSTSGMLYGGVGNVYVAPEYVMDRGRWHFGLGVRVSKVFRTHFESNMYGHHEQIIYPDINIEFAAIPDAMKLYLDLGGGNRIMNYSSLVSRNRWTYSEYGRGIWNILDVSEERLSAIMGLKGRIGAHFSYAFKGGYVNYGNAPLDVVVLNHEIGQPDEYLPAVGYSSYDKAFAGLEWLLDLECLRFDGNVEYTYAWNLPVASAAGLFLPASVSGDVAVEYNWNKRIFAGASCRFISARNGQVALAADGDVSVAAAKIPGYADLGLDFEYVMNKSLSFWLKGGNLLNMTVQESLLYAEKGPYFTMGICLKL